MKTIVYADNAAKSLDRLPRVERLQVTSGIDAYALTGRGDVKALQGREGYRLRIGRYRVIFAEDAATILAIDVLKRETTTYR